MTGTFLKKKPLRCLPAGLLIMLPALTTCLLVYGLYGGTIFQFLPTWDGGDEQIYWHEIFTFSQQLFGGGYYTIEELTPRATFTSFGTHGPLFPLLFGAVARLTGWHPWSPPLFNLVVVGLALAILGTVARPGRRQLGVVALFILTCYPLHLYVPTAMQESLHIAFAIVLASLFARLVQEKTRAEPALRGLLAFTICLAALVRPTWAILYLPLLLLGGKKLPLREKFVRLAGGLAALAGHFLLFSYWAAPYPDNFLFRTLHEFITAPGRGALTFLHHAWTNLALFVSLPQSHALEIALRLAIVLLMAILTLRLILPARNRSGGMHRIAAIALFNLATITVLMLLLYDVNEFRSFRLLAPHLTFAVLLLILAGERLAAWTMIMVQLLTLPIFIGAYRESHLGHFSARADNLAALAQFRQTIAPHLHYQKGASRWQNSILLDQSNLQCYVMAIPAGMGINTVIDWQRLRYPPKSAYLLIDPATLASIGNKARLLPLASSPFGTLYRNLDSPAAASAAQQHSP